MSNTTNTNSAQLNKAIAQLIEQNSTLLLILFALMSVNALFDLVRNVIQLFGGVYG